MKTINHTLLALATALFALFSFAFAETGFSSYVVDHRTGKALYEHDIHAKRYPASLTKVMTLYIVFEDLERKRISLSDRVRFSNHAAAQPPSKIGVPAGQSISLDLAIKALIVKSANDVAAAVAETISGSEAAFVNRMNQTAKKLGMHSTNFANPHGLFHPSQVTTANDMIKLGIAIYEKFPQYYPLFKTPSFVYNNVTFSSHNRVNKNSLGADGIKTGYIRKSGFNLLTSAERNKRRIFAVVLGGRTTKLRDDLMMTLIDDSFNNIRGRTVKTIRPTITRDMTVLFTPTKDKPFDKTILTDSKYRPTPVKQNITQTAAKPAARPAPPKKVEVLAPPPPPKKAPVTIPPPRLESQPLQPIQNAPPVEPNFNSPTAPIRGPIVSAQAQAAVQVGAFKDYNAARDQARLAYEKVRRGSIQVFNTGEYYRALIAGFSRSEAQNICNQLKSNNTNCFVIDF